jgi:uncharacterized membrane protein YkvA (DUF1232 family)
MPAAARLLAPFQRRAERDAERPDRVRALAERAAAKLRKNRGALGALRDDLPALVRLARAWARRDYHALPWRSAVAVVAGLLYFVSPLDAVPDVIPFLGLLDDATVIAYVLRSVGKDVEGFKAWEKKRR